VVEKILRSFPTIYESIVVAIEETKHLSQFLVDELHASLISHENRLSILENATLDHAFKTLVLIKHGRGRGRLVFICRGINSNRGGRTITSNTSGNSSGRGNNQISTQNQPQGQRYDKSWVQFVRNIIII